MRTTKLAITIVVLLFTTSLCLAQIDTSGKTAKFRSAIKKKLVEQVGLSEQTADKFLDISTEHRQKMKDIAQKRKQLMEYIEKNPEASDIGKKLDELFSLDDEAYKNRKNYIESIKAILTPEQIAKTMILRKETRKVIKEKMKDKKEKKKKND